MVLALKINNKSKKNVDSYINNFANEYKPAYQQSEKKSFVDTSIQKLAVDSIIEGYFPKENLVRDMAIKRVNKMLCIILSFLITVVVISYYFVISCEMKLNDLSRQTIILNNENEELQNKLDSLKSFNNVDKTLQQNNMFQRAGQVIETQEITSETPVAVKRVSKKKIFDSAIGF